MATRARTAHAPRGGRGVAIKRAYDPPAPADGVRVLVDRLWPRGIRTEELHADAWLKELSPSTELRRWFAHDPGRWREFVSRYRRELGAPVARQALAALAERARRAPVTLLYAAHDQERNNAVVLRSELERLLGAARTPPPSRPPRRGGAPARRLATRTGDVARRARGRAA